MSQDFDLDLVRDDEEKAIAEKLGLIPFGPCSITPEAWRSLKLSVKAHSSHPEPKEVPFTLLGKMEKSRFIITEAVQIATQETSPSHCTYSIETIKKVEREASKNDLTFVGFLHTHPGENVEPSFQDRTAWLSLMLEFNRPIIYFVLSSSLKVGAYSIPVETFLQLKEAIKFIPFEVRE